MIQEARETRTWTPDGSVTTGPALTRDVVPRRSASETAVPLAQLRRGPVLRVMGEDQAYARLLAFTPVPLPPILVERATMRVIDGMHRVLAARLRGENAIFVSFFDGDEAESFVAAVKANIEHGKPLSLADREHAAERIVALHPEWSDRVIGETCGLAPKTVAGIRRRATSEHPQLHTRTGKDGRARPLDPVPGRQRIAEAVMAEPTASLQKIASKTGTSVGTVRDVRRRLERGESPIPARCNSRSEQPKPAHIPSEGRWTEDTACASTDDARQFARWFDSTLVQEEDCEEYVNAVPLSRSYAIVAEAQARARAWTEFANALETRARKEAATKRRYETSDERDDEPTCPATPR